MTTPAVAAQRYLWGLALGALLGVLYGFLRPLGRRKRALADFLFLLGVFPVWIYFSFAVCQGDLGLGYLSSLFLGGFLFECTLGRLLRRVWGWIWTPVWAFFRLFRKIFEKMAVFTKKMFAYLKKMSTIKMRKTVQTGGKDYELKHEAEHSSGLQADHH